MSRILIIALFVLVFPSLILGQKSDTQKKENAQSNNHKKYITFDIPDSKTRDSLVKLFGVSIFVDMSIRDAATREMFGKRAHWYAGEFIGTTKTLQTPKKPLAWTTDYEGIFTNVQVDTLNAMISKFEQETTTEIAIVTIDSSWTTKEKLDSSVIALGKNWGLGEQGKNNSILIGLSAGLRRIRISNGNDVVLKLSNRETKKVIDNIMIPSFKEGNYFEGLRKGLMAIMQKLR